MYEECTMYDCLLNLCAMHIYCYCPGVTLFTHRSNTAKVIKLQINAKDIVIVFI